MKYFFIIICLCFAVGAYADDLYSVQKVDSTTYEVKYTRTAKDINGKEVVLLSRVHQKTVEEIEAEIARWQAQKKNAENQIAKLQAEIVEAKKLQIAE